MVFFAVSASVSFAICLLLSFMHMIFHYFSLAVLPLRFLSDERLIFTASMPLLSFRYVFCRFALCCDASVLLPASAPRCLCHVIALFIFDAPRRYLSLYAAHTRHWRRDAERACFLLPFALTFVDRS